MNRIFATLALFLAILGTGISAVAANAQPQAKKAYTATGEIRIGAESNFCVEAENAQNGAAIKIFPCNPANALQTWHSIYVNGGVLITLATHPDLYISGITAEGGEMVLRQLPDTQVPPLNAITYLYGTVKTPGKVNTIRNTSGQFFTIPPVGRNAYWLPLRLRYVRYYRGLIFGTDIGGGIVAGGWEPIE